MDFCTILEILELRTPCCEGRGIVSSTVVNKMTVLATDGSTVLGPYWETIF